MNQNERMHYDHYLRSGAEQLVDIYIIYITKMARELGDKLTHATLADVMNEADIELNLLDTVFTDDRGKLELLIDIYESMGFEFPWDEGLGVDDFFINFTNVGFLDMGDEVIQCLDINGKPVQTMQEDWFSRVAHRRFQPVRYRKIDTDKMIVQFIGLYRRWETTHVPKQHITTINPYK